MRAKRFRAPSVDGGLLQEPPLATLGDVVRSNRSASAAWRYDVQGRRVDALRVRAREDLVAVARRFHAEFGLPAVPEDLSVDSIVAGGHQPELFHPGVWIKNFAVAALARGTGSVGFNLIVDNDIPKGSSILAPRFADGVLTRTPVDFDVWAGESPFEAQTIVDAERFASFGDRLRSTLDGLVPDPLIERFWPLVLETDSTRNVGLRFSKARRSIEESWGASNLEVPLSAICETDAFLWFASHLMAQLPRYQAIHNDALGLYRRLNHIRSKNHPVADLRSESDAWLEAPFWVWRDESPRRRALWVRQKAATVELRIGGEDRSFVELPLGPDKEACCAVEELRTLPDRGIRVRTRALTTTMFARVFLSDLFIHGIGGAKYDELGDEITTAFFGFRPPEYATSSLTMHLGLNSTGASKERLLAVESRLRSIEFNPQRFLADDPPHGAAPLLAERAEALAAPLATRRQRVSRHHRLRDLTTRLAAFLKVERNAALEERNRLRHDLRQEGIVRSREFSSVVHSAARLERVLTNLTGLRG